MPSHSEILSRYGIHAKKSLGQNFLVNDTLLEEIADTLDVTWKNILEIGPGYGALTERILAKHPASLTLIELDTKMVEILQDRKGRGELPIGDARFEIVQGDVLRYIPEGTRNKEQGTGTSDPCPLLLAPCSYSVIANIPYYITSPILFRFLHELEDKPDEMLILMQREVADKIVKKRGNKNSYLSLAMEYACSEIREVLRVAPGNFVPPPKVESSVLHFVRRTDYNQATAQRFLRIVSAGFSAPRKKLLSNLAGGLGIPKDNLLETFKKLGWSETIRAEEVDLEGWKELLTIL